MSSRYYLKPQHTINAGDLSKATVTSAVTIIDKFSLVSYQFVWTAGNSPSGTIAIQVSNNYALNPDATVANAGTWTTVYFYQAGALANSITVSGNTGNAYLQVGDSGLTGAYAIRAVYTKISGTGTLDGYICGKVT